MKQLFDPKGILNPGVKIPIGDGVGIDADLDAAMRSLRMDSVHDRKIFLEKVGTAA